MKIQRFGIFGKVFLYTMIILLLTISVTVLVFAQQFKDFYDYLQIQQYTTVFEPLKTKIINEEDLQTVIQTANEFHDKNQAFAFNIETKEGAVLYKTRITRAVKAEEIENGNVMYKPAQAIDISKKSEDSIMISLDKGLVLRTVLISDNTDLYKEFAKKVVFIVFLLLCASIAGAVLFARGITNPIKHLAADTRKMASLEPVSVSMIRRDEVGQLATDVHNLYEKLKMTISKLEAEILREKGMEENQRYFFSTASHELKTPIAAASALLEGMIAGIGDYKNHQKYLRECLNMMNAQNRIITEMLEIVKLSDDRILPDKENINLLNLISTLLPEYNTLADKKEQSITVNVPETVHCYSDKKMLGTVLSNVMMNAIQNSPAGEDIRIWSDVTTDEKIRLNILNTNAIIDEGIKEKLFEPFYRTDKARSRNEERSGLGLTIVKKILDSMDIPFDLIVINSDVVFWLELPA
ncbi:MAG TPA: HAMP domain-containing sensor histidine kinase, partial [Anaerovoracaceae bacterium]|nr:HAMP domain-containing sensor histidine kinase [Anaerovoracaceae bacterium]